MYNLLIIENTTGMPHLKIRHNFVFSVKKEQLGEEITP
jgi:hypothetical protein